MTPYYLTKKNSADVWPPSVMLVYPSLTLHWLNVSCLLGMANSCCCLPLLTSTVYMPYLYHVHCVFNRAPVSPPRDTSIDGWDTGDSEVK